MVIRGWVAAQAGGMDRQTLRDWVHRYNADGLTGLADRPRPGCQPRLTETQRGEVAEWVESGPDLKTDGVVRWRCADLRDRIAAKFHVHLHERSVAKLLKKLNFSSMSGRPVHPQSDLEAQEAFKKTLPGWRAPRSRGSLPAGRSKSGFRMKPASESQGTLTRIWAKRGTRPRIKLDRKFTWAYLFGAICPARGTGAALVMPTVLPLPPYAPADAGSISGQSRAVLSNRRGTQREKTNSSGGSLTLFAAASSASPRHRKQSATIGLTPTGPTLASAELAATARGESLPRCALLRRRGGGKPPFCALQGPLGCTSREQAQCQ